MLSIGLTAWMSIHGVSADGQSPARDGSGSLPVRGLHLMAPSKQDLAAAVEFIHKSLPRAGVNTLILEFDYGFDFKSRPEFADPSALGKDEVHQIVQACREEHIELIPQINCLGHQSWARHNGRLLEKHPEFDETPGKFPNNDGIYCRSYCPLHPEVHQVLFDLMDELARACEATSFHIGMDEVFILADPDCPRCKGKDPARLFADEVKTLHAHLKSIGCRTWMWGDRFLDGKTTGLGKWEASENGTASAIDLVPKDIVICDWHYDRASETALLFAKKGFDVVECPWRKTDVALAQLAKVRAIRDGDDPVAGSHALGMMQTTWCGFTQFSKALQQQESGAMTAKDSASESARCFLTLFKAIREKQ
jgi:Glycosyl hydrolase family 20, catalytic domain